MLAAKGIKTAHFASKTARLHPGYRKLLEKSKPTAFAEGERRYHEEMRIRNEKKLNEELDKLEKEGLNKDWIMGKKQHKKSSRLEYLAEKDLPRKQVLSRMIYGKYYGELDRREKEDIDAQLKRISYGEPNMARKEDAEQHVKPLKSKHEIEIQEREYGFMAKKPLLARKPSIDELEQMSSELYGKPYANLNKHEKTDVDISTENRKSGKISWRYYFAARKPHEFIKGGLSSGKSPKDFNQDQLKKGIKVEMEHTTNPKIAREIAQDHLVEDKFYYTHLLAMEKKYEKKKPRKYMSYIPTYVAGDLPVIAGDAVGTAGAAVVPLIPIGVAAGAVYIGAKTIKKQVKKSKRKYKAEKPEEKPEENKEKKRGFLENALYATGIFKTPEQRIAITKMHIQAMKDSNDRFLKMEAERKAEEAKRPKYDEFEDEDYDEDVIFVPVVPIHEVEETEKEKMERLGKQIRRDYGF